MALTETWLKDHKDAELHIEGYQLFRSDRKREKKSKRGRLSGGVAAYIHKDLADETTVKLQFSNGKVEVLGLYSAVENIYIAVIYRQPNDSIGGHTSAAPQLRDALKKLQVSIDNMGDPAPNIIVCGDFNIPNVDWSNLETNSEKSENSLLSSVSEFANKNFLHQFVNYPTHRDGNTLDLIFTNNPDLIHNHQSFVPALSSISDHYSVECDSLIGTGQYAEDNPPTEFNSPLDALNFHSNDIQWTRIIEEFGKVNWEESMINLSPEEKLKFLMSTMHEICLKYVPKRKSQFRTGKPKIPRERGVF